MPAHDDTAGPGDEPGGWPAPESYDPPHVEELGTLEDMTRGIGDTPGDDAFTGTVT